MDSARRPRVNRNPAQPFSVVGTNGVPPQLPQVQPINVPSVEITDTAAQSLSNANAIVNRSFEYNQQVIESNRQATTAEAQNYSSGFAGVFADLARGIEAGVNAYGAYKTAEAEEQSRIAEAQQEAALARQERLDSTLGPELEQEIRARAVELYEAFVANGTDNGSVTTFNEFLAEQRRLYISRGLSPEVAQQATNIGFEALGQVQRQFGERIAEQNQALRNELIEQNVNALYDKVAPTVLRLRHNPTGSGGLAVAVNSINGMINEFFLESDLGPLERLTVINDIHGRIAGEFDEAMEGYYAYSEQRVVLLDALSKAQAVQLEHSSNPTRMAAELAVIEQELRRVGLDISLSDIYQNDFQSLSERVGLETEIARLREAQGTQAPELSFEDQRNLDILTVSKTAWNWINNPSDPSNVVAMERARRSDASNEEKAALAQYEEFQDDRQTYLEITRTTLPQLRAEIAQVQRDIELYKDEFNPDNRLGPARFTDEYLRAIVELRGLRERSYSDEAEAAIARFSNISIATIQSEISQYETQRDDLARRWIPNGFNIENPSDSSYIDPLVEAAETYLRNRNTEIQSGASPPLSSSGIPLQPSTFHQGLPPLPAR